MKLLQINTSLNTSSTGKIVCQIGKMCIDNGDESYIAFSGKYPENTDIVVNYFFESKYPIILDPEPVIRTKITFGKFAMLRFILINIG